MPLIPMECQIPGPKGTAMHMRQFHIEAPHLMARQICFWKRGGETGNELGYRPNSRNYAGQGENAAETGTVTEAFHLRLRINSLESVF